MLLHGSCAALGDEAVLLLGPPGSGKSDLLLRLIDRGFSLVGDDQVLFADGKIRAPQELAGMIELRGLGLFKLDAREEASLRLVVHLEGSAERLPHPRTNPDFGTPEITLDPWISSAPIRVHWALDALSGRRTQHCGAFIE
jgi:HPr kinase/phosphorylase